MTGGPSIAQRVLLVDDHPLVRSAVRQAISGPDLEVVGEAGDCDEALVLAASLRPDLVLLDLDLPGRSGFEFLREVRAQDPAVRVVVLTVSGSNDDLVSAIRAGAVGYITKDVTAEALLSSVRSALHGDVPLPGPLAASAISSLAGRVGSERAAGPSLGHLTDRERQVLAMVSGGRTDRETALALGVSIRTVEAHVGSILRRLSARNRSEAAQIYRASSESEPPGETSTAG